MRSNNTSGFNSTDSCEDSCSSDASCCSPQGTLKREYPKVGRNDPCPCGSQKKFKKCCGKNT